MDRFEDILVVVADLVLSIVSSFGRWATDGFRRVLNCLALCEKGTGTSESESSSEESYPGGAATGRSLVFRFAKPLSSESSEVSNDRLRVR